MDEPRQPFRNYVFAEHNWHDYEAHERMVRTKDFLYILNSRPQFANTGPLDAVSSPSFQDLVDLKNDRTISTVQADVFLTPRPVEELYKNVSDLDQVKNLAAEPRYLQKLEELRKVVTEWMEETGDDIPQNLTKDWYLKKAGNIKTPEFEIRGEMPGAKRNATHNNNKGAF